SDAALSGAGASAVVVGPASGPLAVGLVGVPASRRRMYMTPASRLGLSRFSPDHASTRSITPRRYVRSVCLLALAPLEPCMNRYASVSAHSCSASRLEAA